jgi:hypothetical protein
MHPEDQLRQARHLIWRNLPDGVTTFSPCSCGRGAGRGGGPCLACAEEGLAGLIGKTAAKKYVAAVSSIRELEKTHFQIFSQKGKSQNGKTSRAG